MCNLSLVEPVPLDMSLEIKSSAEDGVVDNAADILSLTQPLPLDVLRSSDSGAEEDAAMASCVHVQGVVVAKLPEAAHMTTSPFAFTDGNTRCFSCLISDCTVANYWRARKVPSQRCSPATSHTTTPHQLLPSF